MCQWRQRLVKKSGASQAGRPAAFFFEVVADTLCREVVAPPGAMPEWIAAATVTPLWA